MLLSTPKSIPVASNIVLKRSARKFFDAAQAQGWVVKCQHDDRRDSTYIEAWDWDNATDPTAERGELVVRVLGWFNADSGAYEGYATSVRHCGYGDKPIRSVVPKHVWDDKLQDALHVLGNGPKARADAAVKAAQRKAEAHAQQLRRDAMVAESRAKGDTQLGTEIRARLIDLTKVPDSPNLNGVSDNRLEERINSWRRNRRVAEHARAARKLIHTFAGEGANEVYLSPEEAAASYANQVMFELIADLSRSYYSTPDVNRCKADAEFIREFHPAHSTKMAGVRIIS